MLTLEQLSDPEGLTHEDIAQALQMARTLHTVVNVVHGRDEVVTELLNKLHRTEAALAEAERHMHNFAADDREALAQILFVAFRSAFPTGLMAHGYNNDLQKCDNRNIRDGFLRIADAALRDFERQHGWNEIVARDGLREQLYDARDELERKLAEAKALIEKIRPYISQNEYNAIVAALDAAPLESEE